MKISQKTIQVLENFAGINQSIYFKEGNVIKTRTAAKNLFGEAEIEEHFPKSFAVYDLTRFLNVIGLFDQPELTFEEDAVLVGDGKNHVRYAYTEPAIIEEVVVNPEGYEKQIRLPATIAEFVLKQEDMAKVLKAAKVLNLPNITFKAEDGSLQVIAQDASVSSSDSFKLDIGKSDETFSVNFKIETMRMIPGNYNVVITEKAICEFSNPAASLVYYVGAEVKR